jgi:hypothetical protein
MLKSNSNMLPKKLNAKKTRINDFWSSTMEKTNTLFVEMIHIMPECVVHLYDHQNKVMPLIKPSIFVDLNNGAKFHNYTTNQLMTHEATISLTGSITNHIDNEDLVFQIM